MLIFTAACSLIIAALVVATCKRPEESAGALGVKTFGIAFIVIYVGLLYFSPAGAGVGATSGGGLIHDIDIGEPDF